MLWLVFDRHVNAAQVDDVEVFHVNSCVMEENLTQAEMKRDLPKLHLNIQQKCHILVSSVANFSFFHFQPSCPLL